MGIMGFMGFMGTRLVNRPPSGCERSRRDTDMLSMAVGVIIEPQQAEDIVASGQADFVALGREIMHNPFWPLHAAHELGADPDFAMWPPQYGWAVDRRDQIRRGA